MRRFLLAGVLALCSVTALMADPPRGQSVNVTQNDFDQFQPADCAVVLVASPEVTPLVLVHAQPVALPVLRAAETVTVAGFVPTMHTDTTAVTDPVRRRPRERASCRCTIWDVLGQLFHKDPGRKRNKEDTVS